MTRKEEIRRLAKSIIRSHEDDRLLTFAYLTHGSKVKLIKAHGVLWYCCLN